MACKTINRIMAADSIDELGRIYEEVKQFDGGSEKFHRKVGNALNARTEQIVAREHAANAVKEDAARKVAAQRSAAAKKAVATRKRNQANAVKTNP